MRVILVGGAGFVGKYLVKALVAEHHTIVVIDVCSNAELDEIVKKHSDRVQFKAIDISNIRVTELASIFSSIDAQALISIAGFGMSGKDMLSLKCHSVNVDGTKNLLLACKLSSIQHFIYTSTYNVAYGGNEIVNGNEATDYYPVNDHTDEYSRSKAIAEQVVLFSNGEKLSNGKTFLTACIRPAAIYGPDEKRHIPRVVDHIDRGIFLFLIGNATVDWVHVNNLVQAYLNLLSKLTKLDGDSKQVPSGQAYCISDDSPIKNFEFFRPLVAARRRTYPTIVLPTSLVLGVSRCMEICYHLTGLSPLMTRTEVLKVGRTHYFSMEKARTELDYRPTINSKQGAQELADVYSKQLTNKNYFQLPSLIWWLLIGSGMASLAVVAFASEHLHVTTEVNDVYTLGVKALEKLSLFLFGSHQNLRYLFHSAVAVHVLEGVYAYYLASKENMNTSLAWGVQTFLLGYPSLSLLQGRIAWLKANGSKTS